MIWRRRRGFGGDDSGASLVLALIFVTVVSVIIAVVLSFVDVSFRNTIVLREQAAEVAAADGAAQVAINALREGTYAGAGNCFAGGSALALPNFAAPPSGHPLSAAVGCELDPTNSANGGVTITSSNKPPNAVLTTGANFFTDNLSVDVSGNRDATVRGSVFANSTVNVTQGRLIATSSVKSRGLCLGQIVSSPSPRCLLLGPDPEGEDPGYSAPAGAATARTVPSCRGNGKVVTFQPGLYDSGDINDLNNLTKSNGCRDAIFWFQPGTYYFDLPSNKPWDINTGYVLGGTPTEPLVDNAPPAMPGACRAPVPPTPIPAGGWPGPAPGVTFVLGGASQLQVHAAKVELCGTYSTSTPPIVLYGLSHSVNGVPAQSGCVVTGGCETLSTDLSPNSAFVMQGTTYLPSSWVDLKLNNNTQQAFRSGIVARDIDLSITGSVDLTKPMFEVPDTAANGGRRTVVYLTVYLCPNAATCDTSGAVRLRVKVGLIDPSGTPVAGARQIAVYSWSVLH